MILILTATALEQDRLRESLADPTTETFAHRPHVSGALEGVPVSLLETGIGCVNTAQALTAFLETHSPQAVLQVGVGGAYRLSGLGVGDLAVAASETYADAGVATPDGWRPLDLIGIPVLRTGEEDIYNVIPVDTSLATKAASALEEMDGLKVQSGPFATVQQCSGVADLGDVVAERFKAICENMEGAAAAHLAALYGVPFLEVRAISNLVENRDLSKWDLPGAASRVQSAALTLLPRLFG